MVNFFRILEKLTLWGKAGVLYTQYKLTAFVCMYALERPVAGRMGERWIILTTVKLTVFVCIRKTIVKVDCILTGDVPQLKIFQ